MTLPWVPWAPIWSDWVTRPAERRKRKRFVGGNPCIRIEKNLETPLRDLFLFLSFSLLPLLCFLYRICLFICSFDSMLKTLRTMFDLSWGGKQFVFA